MKYVVDRIIDGIVYLENLEDKSNKEINISLLPSGIHEGSILIEKITYEIDDKTEKSRRELLRNRLDRLKKDQ